MGSPTQKFLSILHSINKSSKICFPFSKPSLFFSLSLHPHQPSNDIASSSPAIKPTPPSWPLPIPSTLSLVPKSPPTTRPEPATPPSSLKFFWLGGPLSLAPIYLFYFIPNWNLDFPKELSLLCSFSSIAE